MWKVLISLIAPIALGVLIHPVLYFLTLVAFVLVWNTEREKEFTSKLLELSLQVLALLSLPVAFLYIAFDNFTGGIFSWSDWSDFSLMGQLFFILGYGLAIILVGYWVLEMIRLFHAYRQDKEAQTMISQLLSPKQSR